MPDKAILSVKCPRCGGTGTHKVFNLDNVIVDENCTLCLGVGTIACGNVDVTDLMDELDWIKKKIKKILQKLDIPEE